MIIFSNFSLFHNINYEKNSIYIIDMVINKKEFIDRVEFEDKNLISNVYDKIMLCKKINNVVYTEEFYPPNVWNL